MPLIFPSSPSINQTYQSGSSATYKYDGNKWSAVVPATSIAIRSVSASFALNANNIATANSGSITLVVGATTTAPTAATTNERNIVSWDYRGDGYLEYQLHNAHASATGATAGSGDYLFSLPSGYTFDLTEYLEDINDVGAQKPTTDFAKEMVPGSNGFVSRGGGIRAVVAIVWDATRFRIFTLENIDTAVDSSRRSLGSGNFAWNTALYAVSLNMTVKVIKS
jgi:hypothetical protein